MKKNIIMTAKQIKTALKKIIDEIIKKNKNLNNIVIIGIQTRGVYLAQRIAKEIKSKKNVDIPLGIMDITLYRDDFTSFIKTQPKVQKTNIPFNLIDKNVIMIDDVLYTGRTIRAALNELIDFGRPERIQLAVLIDRGNRELPIQPDYVGKNIRTKSSERVKLKLKEVDGIEEVIKL